MIQIILPFLMYALYSTRKGNFSNIEFYFYLSFFYFMMIISLIHLINEFVENIHEVNIGKPKYMLILEILKFIFLVSLFFSTYYWIIYDFKGNNFLYVTRGNKIEIFLDFYFYSITSFIMNNGSEIKPNSFLAKSIVLTQSIASFSTIVIYISQHKEFGNIFKKIEDRINKK